MRQKLNDSPVAQIGLVVVLVAVGAFLFLRMGDGEEAADPTAAPVDGAIATGGAAGDAAQGAISSLESGSGELPSSVPVPPPPTELTAAYEAGETVVLLVVDDGGIDDNLTSAAAERVSALPGVAFFEVPVKNIARYAAITVGVDVNRVPALVVMRPIDLSGGVPQATVEYGFQTPQSVVQAVRDASYDGPDETYHPD